MTPLRGDAAHIAASLDDPQRFAAVFDRHADAVHGYLARRAGRQTADDLVGEVFCVAFERRSSFDLQRDDARPWLYGIAANLLHRTWRSARRRDRAFDRALHERVPAEPSTTERTDARERFARTVDALLRLPDVDREALLLHTWEHLAYEDVATAMDVPVGTVRSRISRARGRLRELLGDSGQEPATDDGSVASPHGLAATNEGPRR